MRTHRFEFIEQIGEEHELSRPCLSCERHVRASEAACPFCSSALPSNLAAVPAATRRLSRFAAFTFATAVAVTGAATMGCSGGDDDGTEQSEGELGGIMPMYGAPVPAFDAGSGCEDTDNANAEEDEFDPGTIVAMYGLPPQPVDAGPAPQPCAKDAGSATDAGAPTFDGGGFLAMYGAPVWWD